MRTTALATGTGPGDDDRARRCPATSGFRKRFSRVLTQRRSACGSRTRRRPRRPASRTTLYRIGDALGMLRDTDERDAILTMDWRGTGTMTVDGQSCTLANYRGQVRYSVPAHAHRLRVRATRRQAGHASRAGDRRRDGVERDGARRRRDAGAQRGDRSARRALVAAVFRLQGGDARRRATRRRRSKAASSICRIRCRRRSLARRAWR